MKRIARLVAAATACVLALSACGTPAAPGGSSGGAASADPNKVYQIGAVTIVSHPALDAVYKGFVDGLKQAGYEDGKNVKVEFQNPQGDQATLTSIANTYASAKKDLYFAIATPPLQALAQVIKDAPILFAGVTDPVKAGAVASWDKPGGNVTGMSDLSPVKEQLALLKEIAPSVKTVGIVYSSSEANSEVLVELAKAGAAELGLQVKTATVVNSSEVGQAAASLDVDAYYVPTDNTVVSALEALLQVAEQKKRPVISGDADSVGRGAVASLSIDYYKQGIEAAKMGVELLKGAKPADMPVQTQKDLELIVNPAAAARMGVTLPESVTKRATKTV